MSSTAVLSKVSSKNFKEVCGILNIDSLVAARGNHQQAVGVEQFHQFLNKASPSLPTIVAPILFSWKQPTLRLTLGTAAPLMAPVSFAVSLLLVVLFASLLISAFLRPRHRPSNRLPASTPSCASSLHQLHNSPSKFSVS